LLGKKQCCGRSFISLKGTTNNITQQLEVDKGGVGSIQKFNIVLVDKNQELTKLFQPGNVVPDLLSLEANVYLNFEGGAHPEDSIRIFNGIVGGQQASPGRWRILIDHPETLKRQDLYEQINTNLDGAIDASVTTIVVNLATGYIEPGDVQRSFLLIDEEIIEYTTITLATNTFTGITRGALGTTAAAHDDDAQVQSFYTLSGGALDLALKIMLSTSGEFSIDNPVTRFVKVTNTLTVANGILLAPRIKEDLGLELGDLVTITGASNGANNVTAAVIAQFQIIPSGTVVTLTGVSLVEEIDSSAVASFKSQFDLLPEGCGMKPSQVDVAQHIRLRDFFATALPDYLLYIKDTISTAKEFLVDEVYKPQGFYQVPRKGRASVNITQPPLVLEELIEITDENVLKASQNSMDRQLNKNFFNNVVYAFDIDELEDKFRAGTLVFSERSRARIPNVGNKTLKIESRGLRDDAATRNFIENQSRRFSDRYQFAAESIRVKVNYKTGFNIEISDVVLFGNSGLQIPDINNGTRDFEPRLMEVINKSINLKGGPTPVTLTLLDTGFGIDGRFFVISPNSFIASGATTTNIPLKASFGTTAFEVEGAKWVNFVGQQIRVRNQGYTFDETVRFIQFLPGAPSTLVVSPALSSPPPEDFLVDLPDYADSELQQKMKTIHGFIDPVVTVVSGISTTSFTVSLANSLLFFVDAFIRVHSVDFTDNSTPGTVDDDAQVVSVDTGTGIIVVTKDLGFTPVAGNIVDLIGFAEDDGLPYRSV